MLNHTGWYFFSVRHSHLAYSASRLQLHLYLSSPQNYLSLVAPPILPAWLLANHFYGTNTCDKSLQICTRALFHHSQIPNKFRLEKQRSKPNPPLTSPTSQSKRGQSPVSSLPHHFLSLPSHIILCFLLFPCAKIKSVCFYGQLVTSSAL